LYNLKWYGCLVKEVDQPEKYGIFQQNKDGTAKKIIEKPQEFIWNLANIWVYKFPANFIKIIENIEISPRWEYELPSGINKLIENIPFQLIKQEWEFIDIWYVEDIAKAEKILLNKN
jgi:dTDP-glucose pyrophosphorylase